LNSELHLGDVTELNYLLNASKVTRKEILDSCYSIIESSENLVKAWEHITPRNLQSEARIFGKLDGLCLGVKDIIATKDSKTKMGTSSKNWKGTTGAFDSRVISKLRAAGATIIGKNKTSEFAVHKSTDTINPRNNFLQPGTSSSGSAAAVAAGHVSISIATQTAGSIIRPSSYCGVIGFKPSYGQIPRTGILKTTEMFDTVGIIGNSVANIQSVFEEARVKDANHPLHNNENKTIERPKFLYAIGPKFDVATQKIRTSALEKISTVFGVEPVNIEEVADLDFKALRNIHEYIYAKELSYFLKSELDLGNISDELKSFADFGKNLRPKLYENSLSELLFQRKKSSAQLSNCIIFALSASDEAPTVGGIEKIDSNLIWTALGLPQISLPLMESQKNNSIGLSVLSGKGNDSFLLDFVGKVFQNKISYLFK
jgi:Asp-tRNA(Asn)/Glu-tRNA(Gln) amidotransferase A subunit family amidase